MLKEAGEEKKRLKRGGDGGEMGGGGTEIILSTGFKGPRVNRH